MTLVSHVPPNGCRGRGKERQTPVVVMVVETAVVIVVVRVAVILTKAEEPATVIEVVVRVEATAAAMAAQTAAVMAAPTEEVTVAA